MKLLPPIHDRALHGAAVAKAGAIGGTETSSVDHGKYARVRQLIWIYFWLLIFEGALRKWVVPQWSNVLLVVRDPVVIVLYFVAMSEGVFPRNGFIWWSVFLAFANLIGSGLAGQYNPVIALYGLRTCFLHLPLIFLIPKVFDLRDIEKIGKWLVVTALPMAVLVMLQFRSEPDAWVNTSVTGEATQLAVSFGKIRPPGTFSFTNGLACYLSLLVAYLLTRQVKGSSDRSKIALAAIPATGIMIGTAGSRAVLTSVALILIGVGYVCLRKPKFFAGGVRMAFVLGIVFVGLQFRQEFRLGMEIYDERITEGGGIRDGLLLRQMSDFFRPFAIINDTPAVGYGIGMGTTVASQLRWGKRRLVFSEGEWERIIRESGPLLGMIYLGMRVGLVLVIFVAANRALLSQENPLPMLIFFAVAPNVLNGQWGVPTALGFATFGAGLCLAAANAPGSQSPATVKFRVSSGSVTDPSRKVRGRSIYSEKLHGK